MHDEWAGFHDCPERESDPSFPSRHSSVKVALCETDLTSNDLVVRSNGDRSALNQIPKEYTRRPCKYSRAGCGINLHDAGALSRHKIEDVVDVTLQLSLMCREGERTSECNLGRVGRRIGGAVVHLHGRSVQPSPIGESSRTRIGGGVENFNQISFGTLAVALCQSRLFQNE